MVLGLERRRSRGRFHRQRVRRSRLRRARHSPHADEPHRRHRVRKRAIDQLLGLCQQRSVVDHGPIEPHRMHWRAGRPVGVHRRAAVHIGTVCRLRRRVVHPGRARAVLLKRVDLHPVHPRSNHPVGGRCHRKLLHQFRAQFHGRLDHHVRVSQRTEHDGPPTGWRGNVPWCASGQRRRPRHSRRRIRLLLGPRRHQWHMGRQHPRHTPVGDLRKCPDVGQPRWLSVEWSLADGNLRPVGIRQRLCV